MTMTATVSALDLGRALGLAKPAADLRSHHLPILGHVLLEARDGALRLVATNLNESIRIVVPADGVLPPLCVALDGATKTLGKVKAGRVELKKADGKVHLDGAVRAELPTMSDKDFPKVLDTAGVEATAAYPATEFLEALRWVARASSTDETREHLCSVLFCPDRLIATDGHRMHSASLRPLTASKREFLLRASSVKALLRTAPKNLDALLMGFVEGQIVVALGEQAELVARLSDAQFPLWRQVIPRENERRIRVDGTALSTAVEALKPITKGNRTSGLTCTVETDRLVLVAEDNEGGRAEQTVPAEVDGDFWVPMNGAPPERLRVGLNAHYLADALSGRGGRVELRLGGELDPVLVCAAGAPAAIDETPGRFAVVMPMRI